MDSSDGLVEAEDLDGLGGGQQFVLRTQPYYLSWIARARLRRSPLELISLLISCSPTNGTVQCEGGATEPSGTTGTGVYFRTDSSLRGAGSDLAFDRDGVRLFRRFAAGMQLARSAWA